MNRDHYKVVKPGLYHILTNDGILTRLLLFTALVNNILGDMEVVKYTRTWINKIYGFIYWMLGASLSLWDQICLYTLLQIITFKKN